MDDMDYLIGEIIYDSQIEELQKEEDTKDANRISKETSQLKTIIHDLNQFIDDDKDKIVFAERITEDTHKILEDTKDFIDKARESQKKAFIMKGTLISTGIGLCIGGPIGGILGNTIHLTILCAMLGGVSVGGFTGTLTNYILRYNSK
jgi:hypothetical protein